MKTWIFALFAFSLSLFADAPVVLVTGGAGYIGSHTCKALKEAGFTPVAYDSLCNGSADAVKWGPLIIGDLAESEKLASVIAEYKPIAVIHFAALRAVGDSVLDPYSYYKTNVAGTLNLLHAMKQHNVKNIIFSSTCSVYGNVDQSALAEDFPKAPENPYAWSKLMMEQMLRDFARAYDFKTIVFRYFNAAGMDCAAGLKRNDKTFNFLIPRALQAVLDPGQPLPVYGVDYPTLDGTGIRDYIHVIDLADAHVLGLQYLLENQTNETINLGTGKGFSVFEVIQAIEEVTGYQVPREIMPRREGDIAQAVADPSHSKKILRLTLRHSTLREMIESEWKSMKEASCKIRLSEK